VNISNKKEETPLYIELLCYLSYAVLIIFGYLRDFLRNTGLEKNKSALEINREV
jgi:serine palmitoyltransferase